MWLAYYTQEEIAAAIGFSRPAVSQFIESLNSVRNGADAVSDKLDGNGELGNAERYLEFEEDDTNSLGVYEIEEGAVAAGRVVRGTGARGAGAVQGLVADVVVNSVTENSLVAVTLLLYMRNYRCHHIGYAKWRDGVSLTRSGLRAESVAMRSPGSEWNATGIA
jgi:hypothetical protein